MNVILCGVLRSNRAARSMIAVRIGAGHMILISAATAACGKTVMPAAIANARAPNCVRMAILHRMSAPGSEQGIVPAKTRALEGAGCDLSSACCWAYVRFGQKHALPFRSIAVRSTPISRPRQDGLNATLWPSRPGEFHPEPLTDPDLTLSRHPARATARRLPPSIEYRVPPVAG